MGYRARGPGGDVDGAHRAHPTGTGAAPSVVRARRWRISRDSTPPPSQYLRPRARRRSGPAALLHTSLHKRPPSCSHRGPGTHHHPRGRRRIDERPRYPVVAMEHDNAPRLGRGIRPTILPGCPYWRVGVLNRDCAKSRAKPFLARVHPRELRRAPPIVALARVHGWAHRAFSSAYQRASLGKGMDRRVFRPRTRPGYPLVVCPRHGRFPLILGTARCNDRAGGRDPR